MAFMGIVLVAFIFMAIYHDQRKTPVDDVACGM